MSSIDIDSAIAAHRIWATRLRYRLEGISEEPITVQTARDHTQCILGKWLFGSGEQYNLFEQYFELIEVHRSFHEIAAEIVTLHQNGERGKAESLLKNEFQQQSDKVVELLLDLKIDGF
jgi:hypothetical protein